MLTMRLLICLLLFWITEAQVVIDNSGQLICNGSMQDLLYEDTAEELNCDEKIFIKIRTCDNCVEMDSWSIAGLAVGNLVSTALIGVAVYLVASHAQMPSRTADSQSSDRQQLIQGNSRPRVDNGIYQDLNTRRSKDTYDVLAARR
ncbi:unnamed protein product [Arctogadus glacialis]